MKLFVTVARKSDDWIAFAASDPTEEACNSTFIVHPLESTGHSVLRRISRPA